MFHDYLARYEARDCRRALIELFKVLDTEEEDREDYLEEELVDFPYVNGGLFADESVEILEDAFGQRYDRKGCG